MQQFEVPPGKIVAMGIKAVARPRPGLSMEELIKRMEDLGNEIIDDQGGSLLLVEKVYPISYDPVNDFAPMELLWKCDFCGAYSRDEATIVKHEKEVHDA